MSKNDPIHVWYMAIECKEDHPTQDNAHNLPMHLGHVTAAKGTFIIDLRRVILQSKNCPFRGKIKDVYKLQNIADDDLKQIDIKLNAIMQEKKWSELAVKVSGRATVHDLLRTNYGSGVRETLDCLLLIVEPSSSSPGRTVELVPSLESI
ncbi:hypothetical protein PQX77_005523 [Marasmius sp. AFHP31]|nr:hypothetical protein PQX77_005523 [Marasmius sp. AFHP31]